MHFILYMYLDTKVLYVCIGRNKKQKISHCFSTQYSILITHKGAVVAQQVDRTVQFDSQVPCPHVHVSLAKKLSL